jgi:hypothetical protein
MSRGDRTSSTGGVLRYVATWLTGGAAVAALVVLLVGSGSGDQVELPPVKQTRLEDAARTAHCEFRIARAGEALDPPVSGPRVASPLRPGVYEKPEPPDGVVAALRYGAIVVHYRPSLPEERVDQLEELQEAVPAGTIVIPNAAPMRYEVAVTAWRRLLGCGRFTDQAIDALRLFQGRFIGRGPDRPG